MLRQAIERGPDELQLIMREVLNLPERKLQELAKLLEDADLANIIGASKLVADRLKFLTKPLSTTFHGTTSSPPWRPAWPPAWRRRSSVPRSTGRSRAPRDPAAAGHQARRARHGGRSTASATSP